MNCLGKIKKFSSKEIKDSKVSIGFECLDRELFNPDKCYDLLGKSGIKYARVQTGWAKCEIVKGIYDFSWLDKIVDNLIKNGVKPWFNVGFGNPIYMDNTPNPTGVGCVPLYYGDEVTIAWCSFISALTKHYIGRVEQFEIWNEPDLPHFWHPETPSPIDYAKLVKCTGDIIKKEYPKAKIGACISASYKFEFIKTLLANLPKSYLDFFCYHAYSRIPEHNYIANIKLMRQIFDESGSLETELWQGEAGYASWFPKNHWLVPEGGESQRSQAIWLLRRYFLDIYAGAEMSSYFQMADMWEKPYAKAVEVINKPAAQGILNGITYTPKKSYDVISNIAPIFSGDLHPTDSYFAGYVPSPVFCQLSCVYMSYKKDGYPMYAYYLPSNVSKEEKYEKPFKALILDAPKQPVLVDPYTGKVFEITSIHMIDGILEYHDLPICDYPLIITDKDAISIETE